MNAGETTYQVYAIRYATNPGRTRNAAFARDSDPLAPLPIDFYFWLVVGGGQAIVIDTGMAGAKARALGHTQLAEPVEVLRQLGVDPASVRTVIMTHLHYDHTGNTDEFPNATFHVQAEEMASVTGPLMTKAWLRHAYHVDEIQTFLGYLYADRLRLHGRNAAIADGLSVHWVGGHAVGQEIVRVRTPRGWVVLASDALHYAEEYTRGLPYALSVDNAQMLAAHDRIRELADSDDHVVAGHDPGLMRLYPPASPALRDVAIRLDLPPDPGGA